MFGYNKIDIYLALKARTHNMSIAKMQADVTCLSTFCYSIKL